MLSVGKVIAHIDLDGFYAAVEVFDKNYVLVYYLFFFNSCMFDMFKVRHFVFSEKYKLQCMSDTTDVHGYISNPKIRM